MEGGAQAHRFVVRQHRFRPVLRLLGAAAAFGLGASLYALALQRGVPPSTLSAVVMILAGLVLFVAALALVAGALMAIGFAMTRRGRVAFLVARGGVTIERPARRRAPRAIHRDELAGPFVRFDDVIDEEASATTVMRLGGEETALLLAEGARAGGGSTDTLTWGLFSGSAASVVVTWRGVPVVLAEALTRREAEELAHQVALLFDRLPG